MRIAIVEDNVLLGDNLAEVLMSVPDSTVVGKYRTAEDALARLRPGEVDLLIVDIELPGISGIELISRLRGNAGERFQGLLILVWTIHEDRDVVYGALKAGADGYLLKGCSLAELESSIQSLRAGGAPMSPSIARRVLREWVGEETARDGTDLSVRERTVLRSIAAGHSYKEVAAELSLSTHTVHTHIKHIYEKLQVESRAEALREARRMGIVGGP
jgi:two-component system NarL family response regulator